MRRELDYEKPDVYRAALDFAAWAYTVCRTMKGLDRLTRMIERGNQVREDDIVYGYGYVNGNECRAAGRARLLTKTGCAERERSV